MKLETIKPESAAQIADILSHDEVLARALNPGTELSQVTPDEYYWTTRVWEKKTGGRVYAIIEQKEVVGVISYRPQSDSVATLGYWIRSDYWNRGLASRALRLFRKVAKAKGISHITADIPRDNPATLAIWRKQPIILTESSRYYHPWMELSK